MEIPKTQLQVNGTDSTEFLQTYFSDDRNAVFVDETIRFLMKKLHDTLAEGNFKGKSAYDISISCIIHQLYAICKYYPEITVLKPNETCILELTKWLNQRTGAFDWSIANNFEKELEGTCDQEDNNLELQLKQSIKQVRIFDLHADFPIDLQQADCIVTAWLLDVNCQDQNQYINYFRKMTKLLRPGGLLILIGTLNASYYTVGTTKHCVFDYDECFLRQTLANERFKIHKCEVLDRKVQSDLSDYKQFIYVTAVKEAC